MYVCMYIYIYMYVCIYVYIYIYRMNALPYLPIAPHSPIPISQFVLFDTNMGDLEFKEFAPVFSR
jgi:hypothetical protein